jgi:hypothetical protein
MEKKLLTRGEQAVEWLKSEFEKDKTELEKEKRRIAESLKNFKKEDIVKPEEKLTIWKRIKKVMMGS